MTSNIDWAAVEKAGDQARNPAEKIRLDRWQYFDMGYLLSMNVEPGKVEDWLGEHFEIRDIPRRSPEPPERTFILYGYKQDATRWRLENKIHPSRTVVINDLHSTRQLKGLRGCPVLVILDQAQYDRNRSRQPVIEMHEAVVCLERLYGNDLEREQLYRQRLQDV